MDKCRLDKWLWSVRIFKTRTLSTRRCKEGKVKVDGEKAKPSYQLERGQIVSVKKQGFTYTFKVVDLLEKRVGASVAFQCYKDLTPKEELNKYEHWYNSPSQVAQRAKGAGRPTKKERRELDDFRSRF